MIRIINGTYGYRNPQTGVVEAKNIKSKPFTLSPDREDELVAAGVAEYVGEDVSTDGGNTSDAPASASDELEYSDKNTVAELKAIAEKLGIQVAERATKKQIIEALDAAKASESNDEEPEDEEADDAESDGEDDGEDDGDAPDITAALPE
ncbi:MAG: Rho termination factor N-terminal domain-containing protein [Stomatobaculum sp.]